MHAAGFPADVPVRTPLDAMIAASPPEIAPILYVDISSCLFSVATFACERNCAVRLRGARTSRAPCGVTTSGKRRLISLIVGAVQLPHLFDRKRTRAAAMATFFAPMMGCIFSPSATALLFEQHQKFNETTCEFVSMRQNQKFKQNSLRYYRRQGQQTARRP